MKLIAGWTRQQDELYEAPAIVRWGDGTPATLTVYEDHGLDSHRWVYKGPEGCEKHIFPDVIAHVTFDVYGGCWAAKGNGVETMGLNITDPNASDDQIYAALNTGEMNYRMIVHR